METKYTAHLALKYMKSWHELTESERNVANSEFSRVFEDFPAVILRGAYLTQAYRADTDLFLWMIADDVNQLQDLQLALRRTTLGRHLTTPHAFIGIALESEFNKSHYPAFMRGVPAKEYICFYPFIRSTDWYLLPAEQRAEMLKEHGMVGREFPEVRSNNLYAFGLGDFEWLLSFETDDLKILVEMVRQQREAAARAYTKYEWPFIVGRRFPIADALTQLA